MRWLLIESMHNLFTTFTAPMAIGGSFMSAAPAKAETTYLVLGTHKQPHSASKPQVAKSSSPSIQIIPIISMEQCEAAGNQITEYLYKPIGNLMDAGHA